MRCDVLCQQMKPRESALQDFGVVLSSRDGEAIRKENLASLRLPSGEVEEMGTVVRVNPKQADCNDRGTFVS